MNETFETEGGGSSISSPVVFATQDVPANLVEALVAAGLSLDTVDTNNVDEILNATGGKLVLLWNLPTEAVSEKLIESHRCEDILRDWVSRHKKLLEVLRQNRRLITLVDTRVFSSPNAPHVDLSYFKTVLDLDVLLAPPHSHSVDLSSMLGNLVTTLLPQLGILRECVNELEANSIRLKYDGLPIGALDSFCEFFSDHFREVSLIREQIRQQTNLILEQAQKLEEHAAREIEMCERLMRYEMATNLVLRKKINSGEIQSLTGWKAFLRRPGNISYWSGVRRFARRKRRES